MVHVAPMVTAPAIAPNPVDLVIYTALLAAGLGTCKPPSAMDLETFAAMLDSPVYQAASGATEYHHNAAVTPCTVAHASAASYIAAAVAAFAAAAPTGEASEGKLPTPTAGDLGTIKAE